LKVVKRVFIFSACKCHHMSGTTACHNRRHALKQMSRVHVV